MGLSIRVRGNGTVWLKVEGEEGGLLSEAENRCGQRQVGLVSGMSTSSWKVTKPQCSGRGSAPNLNDTRWPCKEGDIG